LLNLILLDLHQNLGLYFLQCLHHHLHHHYNQLKHLIHYFLAEVILVVNYLILQQRYILIHLHFHRYFDMVKKQHLYLLLHLHL
jgi:hypothetical protein